MSDAAPAILIVIITIFLPPVGVFMVAGCGADLLVNLCLTLLGYFPGHIHAFYLEYVYFDRREQARNGQLPSKHAPGIYSQKVQNGGHGHHGAPGAPVQGGYAAPPQQAGGYQQGPPQTTGYAQGAPQAGGYQQAGGYEQGPPQYGTVK